MPVRWYYLLPADVAGPIVLAASLSIGTREDPKTARFQVLLLIFLIAFSIVGTWGVEHTHRNLFLAHLKEKCARTATEFKLEQARTVGKRRHKRPSLLQAVHMHRSANSSLGVSSQSSTSTAVTDRTGKIFDSIKTDTVNAIQRIEELALAEHWFINEEDVTVNVGQLVGSGGFGSVYTATYHGTVVAVKMPKPRIKEHGTVVAPSLIALASEVRVL